jgi:hypothetical protein
MNNLNLPNGPGFCDAGQLIIDPKKPCPKCGARADQFCKGHWQYDDETENSEGVQSSSKGGY